MRIVFGHRDKFQFLSWWYDDNIDDDWNNHHHDDDDDHSDCHDAFDVVVFIVVNVDGDTDGLLLLL
jgi:hypothetical protein